MKREKETITVQLVVELKTSKTIEQVEKGLTRAIYRGLDSSPHYIAEPKDVTITFNII